MLSNNRHKLLGWVLAINNLKTWCDQYVAIALLKTEVKPMAQYGGTGSSPLSLISELKPLN